MSNPRLRHCADGNHGWCTGIGMNPDDLIIYPKEEEIMIDLQEPLTGICGCACHPFLLAGSGNAPLLPTPVKTRESAFKGKVPK